MTILAYIASALRGVFVCPVCGALVANTDTHDEWHDGTDGDLEVEYDLDPPKQVRWGKGDRAMEDLEDFLKGAKPTTVRVDESVLVDRAARRMRGEVLDPLVYETGMVETDVEPADELKGVFDRLRDSEK